LFELYAWVIFARLILSWLRIHVDHPIISFLYRMTEPVLRPARQLIPSSGGLHFSPISALLVLRIVRFFVVRLLLGVGLCGRWIGSGFSYTSKARRSGPSELAWSTLPSGPSATIVHWRAISSIL